jgi:glycosyltransferase involved in cell wall biosynthesis
VRIAHVLSWISRNAGGLYNSVSGLARTLGQIDGMQVEVFGSRDRYAIEDRRNWLPLQVHVAKVIGPGRLCYTPALRGMIEAFAPDIIHSAAVWTYQGAAVNQIHKRKKVPYVLSTRGTLDAWALRRSSCKKRIALALFQQRNFVRASCLHALNESELVSIRRFGIKAPVCVIPNGVDIPAASDSSPLVSSLRLDGRKILLYLGRIHPKKGLINLLNAWKAQRRNRNAEDWILAVAGWDEGGHEAELKSLATTLGLVWSDLRSAECALQPPVSTLFLGPQFGENKNAWYRACDAFVLPSFSEGLPMAVLEAWAYGKPVLMTAGCNLPEGFAANAAIRVDANPESICRGLDELIGSPASVIRDVGTNGRRLVEARYTWAEIASNMKCVYEWVLGGGPAPSCVRFLESSSA